jgi:hypothetical protein
MSDIADIKIAVDAHQWGLGKNYIYEKEKGKFKL